MTDQEGRYDPDTGELLPEQVKPAPPSPAAERYGARVAAAEREYADAVAKADADYTRAQQYAGLLRQELIEQAHARRDRERQAAQADWENAAKAAEQTGDTPQ